MKEVYPGIYSIREGGGLSGVVKPPENVYLIAGNDGLIFDAGYGTKRAVKALIKEIGNIKKIYQEKGKEFNLTRVIPSHSHPDHFSGLKLLREKLGIKIILTKEMAKTIKSEESFSKSFEESSADYFRIKKEKKKNPDRLGIKIRRKLYRWFYRIGYGVSYIDDPEEIIDENSEIVINGDDKWILFPSPGHAIDHISLYNEKKGVLFSGDNILQHITTWLGPPTCNVEDYVKSIETIQNLPNLNLILPAHGIPIENPSERIAAILKHRQERADQVMSLVVENRNSGITPTEIIDKLYQNERRFIHGLARGWVCLTLKMFEEKGLIKKIPGKKEYKFLPI
jgi:glyoxylase-like metal-dependent hydrolase (beta-lactamase superfamily II)